MQITFGTAIGLVLMVAMHTVIAAVVTRFLRLRLDTRWGAALFSVFLVPVALLISLLFLGQLPIFGGIDRATVVLVTILLPLMLGYSIDLFWMPHPDEVELVSQER